MSSATQHGRDSSTQTVCPIAVRAYFVSAVAFGLTALFGGENLIADPSGDRMEMSLE